MMNILTPADFTTSAWKNGGGITHEIARAEDARGLIWRLSIAEVASDGPFSRFEGLSRILTVIEGAGLVLDTPDGPLAAKPLVPLAFSGDTPVDSRMVAGPIRDFNVIYDANRIKATVTVRQGSDFVPPSKARQIALLCLKGQMIADGQTVAQGSVLLAEPVPANLILPRDGLVLETLFETI